MNYRFPLRIGIGMVAGWFVLPASGGRWSAHLGWLNLPRFGPFVMGSTAAVRYFHLAIGELIADKLPRGLQNGRLDTLLARVP